jgi:16S rRNA (cytosine967-C5)-methyltransferase
MNNFLHQRAKHALTIIQDYKGELPLHHYLKNYFRQHKNMGSRDRKLCSELVYSFFRLGNSYQGDTITKLVYAAFLCAEMDVAFLFEQHGFLALHLQKEIQEKIQILRQHDEHFQPENIFPFISQVSKSIDAQSFALSMLSKPRTFIRIPADRQIDLAADLINKEVNFKIESDTALSFEPRLNVSDILKDEFTYEVQDLSSQETAEYLATAGKEYWLDCCAASGGKSLLLHAQNPEVQIMATDIRESILVNYEERMKKNDFEQYRTQVWDAAGDIPLGVQTQFDGIIADVPCTGSGTWSRHPEQLSFFDVNSIEVYQSKQRAIIKNVVPYLKSGGRLVYITCSVFEQENEQMSEYLVKELGMNRVAEKYLLGAERKSDSMFMATFIKA